MRATATTIHQNHASETSDSAGHIQRGCISHVMARPTVTAGWDAGNKPNWLWLGRIRIRSQRRSSEGRPIVCSKGRDAFRNRQTGGAGGQRQGQEQGIAAVTGCLVPLRVGVSTPRMSHPGPSPAFFVQVTRFAQPRLHVPDSAVSGVPTFSFRSCQWLSNSQR